MKRLGFSLLLSLAVFGSVAAQTGSKHVDLKEITDGKFRQVTAIGEMRSLPLMKTIENIIFTVRMISKTKECQHKKPDTAQQPRIKRKPLSWSPEAYR